MSVRDEMTDLVASLRAEKRKIDATATTVPFTRDIADALGPMLQDPKGQLAEELNSMWDLVKSSPNPAKAIFVPKPSTSNTKWAAISWLQILIVIAQAFSSVPRRIPPKDRRLKLGRLGEVIKTARHAWHDYIKLHGARTVVDQIIDAVGYLVACLPRGLELDGRHLIHNGVRIGRRLSNRFYDFMRLLLEADGRPVDLLTFVQSGVPHPHSTRHRLAKEAEFAFLNSLIQTAPDGGYVLRND